MIEPNSVTNLKDAISECIRLDERALTTLRGEIRPLKNRTRHIQPRATTSISLVGTDGGNNQLQFDPFLIQLVRIVDSSNNEYCLEAVSPTTPIKLLDRRQFDEAGAPQSALGEMMHFLGAQSLPSLSHLVRRIAAARLATGWPMWSCMAAAICGQKHQKCRVFGTAMDAPPTSPNAIRRSAPARALRLHVSDSEKDSRSSNLVSYIASYTPKLCNFRDTASRNLQGCNWPKTNLAISRIRCRVT